MSVLEEGRFVDNPPLNWLLLRKLSPLIGCFQLDWTIQTCRWRELPPGWRPELRASNCWCRKVLDAGTSNKRGNWNGYLHSNISYLQSAVSPRKAVGDMMPVLLATAIAIPDSRNGAVKSTADSRSELIWRKKRISHEIFLMHYKGGCSQINKLSRKALGYYLSTSISMVKK